LGLYFLTFEGDTRIELMNKPDLMANISAHNFIDENYWRGNYELVREMMLKATMYIYEENFIKGFVGLSGNYIAGIFVESNSQSKGIGKTLLNHIKERNKELFLHVYKKNKRAVRFYLREGFVIDNEQIDKNTNEVELVMKWIDK